MAARASLRVGRAGARPGSLRRDVAARPSTHPRSPMVAGCGAACTTRSVRSHGSGPSHRAPAGGRGAAAGRLTAMAAAAPPGGTAGRSRRWSCRRRRPRRGRRTMRPRRVRGRPPGTSSAWVKYSGVGAVIHAAVSLMRTSSAASRSTAARRPSTTDPKSCCARSSFCRMRTRRSVCAVAGRDRGREQGQHGRGGGDSGAAWRSSLSHPFSSSGLRGSREAAGVTRGGSAAFGCGRARAGPAAAFAVEDLDGPIGGTPSYDVEPGAGRLLRSRRNRRGRTGGRYSPGAVRAGSTTRSMVNRRWWTFPKPISTVRRRSSSRSRRTCTALICVSCVIRMEVEHRFRPKWKHRFRRKWNIDFGKWNTDFGMWNIHSGGSGTPVPES